MKNIDFLRNTDIDSPSKNISGLNENFSVKGTSINDVTVQTRQ